MKPSPALLRQLPEPAILEQLVEEGPEKMLSHAFPAGDTGPKPPPAPRAMPETETLELAGLEAMELPELAGLGPLAGPGVLEVEASLEDGRARVFDAGARAVAKVRQDGEEAELLPDEAFGLEAIVLTQGRPAILIQDGHFFPPPSQWQILEQFRDTIEETFRSVGRIELEGHPSYEWVGTGFLVARDVIMTNRHVAEVFCQMGYRRHWKFKLGMSARIDYIEELGAVDSAEFELRNVIGIHEDFDLALFRVRRTSESGVAPPEPLTIASDFPNPGAGRQAYAVGYAAWDGYRNDPPIMRRIFSNIFDVKRLQPGEIMDLSEERGLLYHDCSSLGGNSGSPLIDLETNRVVGLHFGGRYMQGNVAVALWRLTGDPLLQKAKVNFD